MGGLHVVPLEMPNLIGKCPMQGMVGVLDLNFHSGRRGTSIIYTIPLKFRDGGGGLVSFIPYC